MFSDPKPGPERKRSRGIFSFGRKRNHAEINTDVDISSDENTGPKLRKQNNGSRGTFQSFQEQLQKFFGWCSSPHLNTFIDSAMSAFQKQKLPSSPDELEEILANPQLHRRRNIERSTTLMPDSRPFELDVHKRSRENKWASFTNEKRYPQKQNEVSSNSWSSHKSSYKGFMHHPQDEQYNSIEPKFGKPRFLVPRSTFPLGVSNANIQTQQRDYGRHRTSNASLAFSQLVQQPSDSHNSHSVFHSQNRQPSTAEGNQYRKTQEHSNLESQYGKNSALSDLRGIPTSSHADEHNQLRLRARNGMKPRSNRSTKEDTAMMKRQNSFTTDEVIKLNEREKYKMLLESFSNDRGYKPVIPCIPHKINRNQEPTIVKEVIDLTEDDLFKTYMKPCTLVSQSALKKYKAEEQQIEEVYLDSDEDLEDAFESLRTSRNFPTPAMCNNSLLSSEWLKDLTLVLDAESEEREKVEKAYYKKKAERAAAVAVKMRLKKLQLAKAHKKEIVLPEITPEMNAMIDNSIRNTQPEAVVSRVKHLTVNRKDLETLFSLNWLNDEVINFYFELIVVRGEGENFPSVYAFNTFFYPSLKAKGYQSLRRWTRKVDIFSYDMIIIPIHLGVHWCLAVIDFRHKSIRYYDSMHGSSEVCLFGLLKDYLQSESLDKKKTSFEVSGWNTEFVKDIPPQLNGSDCGMFTLKYAEYITRDAEITFTQENMPYFRRSTLYEIITAKLM